MDIKNILARLTPQPPQQAVYTEVKSAGGSFYDYLRTGDNTQDLAAMECTRLYKKCLPFYDSVSRRCEAFSSIPIRAFDTKLDEFVESPLLELLNKPNPTQSGTSFKKALSSFYDIAGEVFIIATVSTKGEPLELYVVRPQDVTVTASKSSGINPIAESYLVSNTRIVETYTLQSDFRYRNKLGNREIWHIREFNPNWCMETLRGLPKAAPLFLQIQQFIAADTNNQSTLDRGGRPSLAWVWQHDDPMTDEQYEHWVEQVKGYEGAINAGRQVLLDNMDIKVVSQNMRDMEFSINRKTVKEDIYSAFGIPLPLVSSASMTMDNLKVSNALFYEQSVLPHTDNLIDELTRFLMPMFKTPDVVLTYNPIDIQPLKERMIDEAKTMQTMNIATLNELREQVGFETLEGGDVIYQPMGLMPMDASEQDEPAENESAEVSGDPAQEGIEEANDKMARFKAYMKTIKSADGKPAFSDEYINSTAITLYAKNH